MPDKEGRAGVPVALHLRLLIFIGFGGALAALLVLGGLVLVSAETGGEEYAAIIGAHALTRHNLEAGIWVAALLLLAVVALLTGLIALYVSFRVAGPLYRFSRNLEAAPGLERLYPIRHGDCLQDVSHDLLHTVEKLREYYRAIGRQVDSVERALVGGEWRRQAQILKERVERARLE